MTSWEIQAEPIDLIQKVPTAQEIIREYVEKLLTQEAQIVDGSEVKNGAYKTESGDNMSAFNKGSGPLNEFRIVADPNSNKITLIQGLGEMGNNVDSARICAESVVNTSDISQAYRNTYTKMASARIYGDAELVQAQIIKDENGNKFLDLNEIGDSSLFQTIIFDKDGNVVLFNKAEDVPIAKGYRVLMINRGTDIDPENIKKIGKMKSTKKVTQKLSKEVQNSAIAILDIG